MNLKKNPKKPKKATTHPQQTKQKTKVAADVYQNNNSAVLLGQRDPVFNS